MTALGTIAAAILAAAPWMSASTARANAQLVERSARKHRVPALLLVQIVDHESDWHPGAINSRSGATGLGQVLPSAYSPCREQEQSPCVALLDPAVNMNAAAAILRANFKMCGGKRWDRALAGYQTGRCKPVKMTRTVMSRWQRAERVVARARIK